MRREKVQRGWEMEKVSLATWDTTNLNLVKPILVYNQFIIHSLNIPLTEFSSSAILVCEKSEDFFKGQFPSKNFSDLKVFKTQFKKEN